MKAVSFLNRFKFALAVLFAVASLLMAVATPALAKSTDTTSTFNYTRVSDDFLGKSLNRDTTWAASLRREINGASRAAIDAKLSRRADYKKMTQQQIVNLSGNVKIYRAQEYLAIAQNLLDAHAGFDKNGNVSSRSLAETSLNNIEAALRKAEFWLNRG